ncbi:MAG TPA: diiron oxygenase [Thermoanaerobaculia bacterium]|nr:diiron oxygenase [Thermoanaerobaculia bacterium]
MSLYAMRAGSLPAAPTTAAPLEGHAVDTGKSFIPDQFTPLFYTPSYPELTAAQRLRYNQLHALYFHEQVIFFETALGRGILEALLRASWPVRLAEILRRFRDQEREHTEMFRRLNQRSAPQLYAGRDFYFVRVPTPWLIFFDWAVARPSLFPMFFWLMLLQEERSLFYSRGYIRHRGSIEESFVQAHRRHLADEVWHVRWDEELIDTLWRRAHPWLRAANARLFTWMLEEFFGAPKRAQLRVLDELVREFPELRELRPGLRRQLLALARDEGYRRSLYSREIAPITFARFDASPEFRGRRICGYQQEAPRQGAER